MAKAKSRIQPFEWQVLIRRDTTAEGKTPGGVIVPAAARDKTQSSTGEVYNIGGDKVLGDGKTQPIGLAIGDTVVFDQWAGINVFDPDTNEELLLMSRDSIKGKILK